MERVVIKQDSRIDTVLHFLYGFFAAFGGLMLITLLYDFITGQLEEGWVWLFLLGGSYFVGGTALLLGFFKPNQQKVIVDEKGIHSINTHWNQSFQWEKLKKVSFDKKSIKVQYKETAAYDSINLPFMLRWGNLGKLENALSNACEINNIDLD